MRVRPVVLILALVLAISGCNRMSEPSEGQMQDAMNDAVNPEGVPNPDPIRITSFEKKACEKPTTQGYRCTFTVTVESSNPLAKTLNDIPSAEFYKDKDLDKWVMRYPF